MATLSKSNLTTAINERLPNNSAGAISATDVRQTLLDTVDSINSIVSSGNHNTAYPFFQNVRASNTEGGGLFVAESGVEFPNATGQVLQTEAYPGPGGINHDDLGGRNGSNDAHTQYLAIDGTRPMEENLPMSDNWINASGAGFDDRGLKFVPNSNGSDDIEVGGSGNFVFDDGSKINSGRSVAKAWVLFDGSGTSNQPEVKSHHNVVRLEHLETGKYKIFLTPGLMKDDNFTVQAMSNSRASASSQEDFSRNTVGVTQRSIDGSDRANFTFAVLNEAGQYVDAELNDVVVFGYDKGEDAQTAPVIVPII